MTQTNNGFPGELSADEYKAWLEEARAGGEITQDQYDAWSQQVANYVAAQSPEAIADLYAQVRELTGLVTTLAEQMVARTEALEARIAALDSNPWVGEYRTKSGKVLTDADIEALAAEAEGGYDIKNMGGDVLIHVPPRPEWRPAHNPIVAEVPRSRVTEMAGDRPEIEVPVCDCPRREIGGGASWFEHSHSCPCYIHRHSPGSVV